MTKEGRVSKVAICEKCNGFVLACHIDFIDAQTEKEFTEFSNEGFTIRLETVGDTHQRKMCTYQKCKDGECAPQQLAPSTATGK